MDEKKTNLVEILQLTLYASDQLENLEVEINAAKVTLDKVTTKIKYSCMREDLTPPKDD